MNTAKLNLLRKLLQQKVIVGLNTPEFVHLSSENKHKYDLFIEAETAFHKAKDRVEAYEAELNHYQELLKDLKQLHEVEGVDDEVIYHAWLTRWARPNH